MDEVTAMAHRLVVEARALIAEMKNWHKGDMQVSTPDGVAYCSLGALHWVASKMFAGPSVYARVETASLNALHPSWMGKVAYFNDHTDTSHADVLAFFDRMIADLAGEPVEESTPVEVVIPWVEAKYMPAMEAKPITDYTAVKFEAMVEPVFYEMPLSFKALVEVSEPAGELVPA